MAACFLYCMAVCVAGGVEMPSDPLSDCGASFSLFTSRDDFHPNTLRTVPKVSCAGLLEVAHATEKGLVKLTSALTGRIFFVTAYYMPQAALSILSENVFLKKFELQGWRSDTILVTFTTEKVSK